jgi:hypothetical protein
MMVGGERPVWQKDGALDPRGQTAIRGSETACLVRVRQVGAARL